MNAKSGNLLIDGAKGCTLTNGGLSIQMLPPEFRIGGGGARLSPETCVEVRYEQGADGRWTQFYRWMSDGRAFEGDAHWERLGAGYSWKCRVWPSDGGAWSLASTSEGSAIVRGWESLEEVQLFHGDTIRGSAQCQPLFDGRYFIPLSEWIEPVNSGRWQCFTGHWLVDPATGQGLVGGVLSQNVWKHTTLGRPGSDGSQELQLIGRVSLPGVDERRYAAGEGYESEPLYWELVSAGTPEAAFSGYLEALAQVLNPCKLQSRMQKSAFWDSWNDRRPFAWDVSHALIDRTTDLLRKRFPTVSALEIDDGYSFSGFHEVELDQWSKMEEGLDPYVEAKSIRRVRRLGAGFAHEPDYAIARDRFPGGLRATRDLIERRGYLSAIWTGLSIIFDAKVIEDHPEWVMSCLSLPGKDPELEKVFNPDQRYGFRVLDPSIPEVRDYLVRMADILHKEWGFGALKLDFWSYAFENDGFRLRNGERSAYELRSWLFTMLRDRLEPGAFLLTGCDIATGNPFLSPWVDSIRYGIDIGNGCWEYIVYTALSGTFLLHVQAWRFFLLNPDSLGLLKELKANEREMFWAWAVATRAVCELSGDLACEPREALRGLQRLMLAPKNGAPAHVAGTMHLQKNEPAAIVWAPGDAFSLSGESALLPDALLAVFNWSDEPRAISVDASAMGLSNGLIADIAILDESTVVRDRPQWTVELPPRTSRLCHLSLLEEEAARVLHSGWQVRACEGKDGGMTLELYGDCPSGFVFWWGWDGEPLVASSLVADLETEAPRRYRLRPRLSEDKLTHWNVSLSAARDQSLPPLNC